MTRQQPTPIFALNLTPASRFKSHLVNYIREFIRDKVGETNRPADRAADLSEMRSERRAAALTALADYIASVPAEDPRMFQLAQVARSLPGVRSWRHGKPFEPTVTQCSLFYSLGQLGGRRVTVAPEDTFSELVSAGVADMAALHRAALAEAERQRDEAVQRAKQAEAKAAPLAQAETDLAAEHTKGETLQGEVDRLQQQVADLEGFLSGDGSKPRRVHVGGGDKNVGIYRSIFEGAPVLEVGYPDAEGKQRWRRLAPDATIDDARRMRERLAGQAHDPEHGGHTNDDPAAAEAPQVGDDGAQQTTNPEPAVAGKES